MSEILLKEYKETLTVEEGLRICTNALKKTIDAKEFSPERIDAAIITQQKRVMERVSKERIAKALKGVA